MTGLLDRWRTLLRPKGVLVETLVLLTLVTVTIGERALLAVNRQVMEAGDTFNFLTLARAFSQGHLVRGEKRLPLYPLTILAGWKGLGIDPVTAATGVSVLAGGGTMALLYLLGRRLGVRVLPLALLLFLWVLAPATNSQASRPLADSLFLFLVVAATFVATVVGSTTRAALLAGGLFGLLLLTRFESIVLAPVLVLVLRFRLPWRKVLIAAIPVLVLYAAWIPYSLHIHGTVVGAYFEEWGNKEGAVGGRFADVPGKLARIASGVGWLRPWEHARWVQTQSDGPTLLRIVGSAAWWVGLLALLGVPWLVFTARRTAIPFLAVFFAFSSLYAMWVVYGRFVVAGEAAFYLSAAAGASALFSLAERLFRARALRLMAAGALTLFLLWMVRSEAPGLMKASASRVFDNEGSGYSLVLAIKELAQRDGRVALDHDLMAMIYLGIIGDPLFPPQRALMLGEAPEVERGKIVTDRTSEQVQLLQDLDIRYLIERDEPRIVRILDVLKKRDVVTATEEIRFPKGQPPGPDFDVTRIHTLSWGARPAPE